MISSARMRATNDSSSFFLLTLGEDSQSREKIRTEVAWHLASRLSLNVVLTPGAFSSVSLRFGRERIARQREAARIEFGLAAKASLAMHESCRTRAIRDRNSGRGAPVRVQGADGSRGEV